MASERTRVMATFAACATPAVIDLPGVVNRRSDQEHGDSRANEDGVPHRAPSRHVGKADIDPLGSPVGGVPDGGTHTSSLLRKERNLLARVVQNMRRLAANFNAAHSSPSLIGLDNQSVGDQTPK